MKTKLVFLGLLFVLTYVCFPISAAMGGAAGGDPVCLLQAGESLNKQGSSKLRGSVAMDALDPVPSANADANVVLRLRRPDSVDFQWFRVHYTEPLQDLSLLGYQTVLCNVLSNPTLKEEILEAFGYAPTSVFKFKASNGITSAEIDGADLTVPLTVPPHSMTLLDVVIFAQPGP